jgi:hypothetical protein
LAGGKPKDETERTSKGFWIVSALAAMIGFLALVVGSTLDFLTASADIDPRSLCAALATRLVKCQAAFTSE